MVKIGQYIYILVLLIGVASCHSTKYVPDGTYLLNRVKITSGSKDIASNDLKPYIRQTPNPSVIGLFKMQLGVYNLSGRDSTVWINQWLRKIGEKPVIYDESLTHISENQIRQFYYNKGYMDAVVESVQEYPDEKKVNLQYRISPNKPYYIGSYTVEIKNKELYNIASERNNSFIKTGQLFDLNVLNNERERITNLFRNLGHYHFTKENLHFYADSLHKTHNINLILKVLNEPYEKDTTTNIYQKYRFNNVYFLNQPHSIYSNTDTTIQQIDSLSLNNYHFFYLNKKKIRPSVLIQSTHIVPDANYSETALQKTYSSLNNLSAIRFVDITFDKDEKGNLDTYITLTNGKPQSLSTDVEGTYSAGYWGVGGNVNYTHKNIFNGSETLLLRGRAAYEYQGRGQNSYELGADIGLKYPTFLLPFMSRDIKRKIRANTQLNLNYDFRQRPKEYTGIVTGLKFKYRWSEQANIKHNIDILDLNYVYYPYISNEYKDYLKTSPYFTYNFQNHLIMKLGYNGSYDGFQQRYPHRSYTTASYSIETAGNLIHTLRHLLELPKGEDGAYQLFGIRYAQYVKGNLHLSRHQIFDRNNKIVYHAGVGVAIPYGNTLSIPFEKRFFSGGANSVRGWTAYQLGPGTFKNKGGYIDYNTQMGDIKLDLNMEYRSKLFWNIEGALFLDAGNVWTIKKYDTQPGGAFKLNSFVEQIGIAYGAGLRFDFSFFIVRLDLGIKLHDPTKGRTERWRGILDEDNFALNLAIGYPF